MGERKGGRASDHFFKMACPCVPAFGIPPVWSDLTGYINTFQWGLFQFCHSERWRAMSTRMK